METDFILRVLQITEGDNCDDIHWIASNDAIGVRFFVSCSDEFFWGSADSEELTPENVERLAQAYRDAGNACDMGEVYGAMLFCARERKERPQGAAYPNKMKELWPLFDVCGPERETGFGNPYKPGEHKRGSR